MSNFVERRDVLMAEIDRMRAQNTEKILRLRDDQLVYDEARSIYDMQVTAARIDSVDFDNRWHGLVAELDDLGRESYLALDALMAKAAGCCNEN